MDPSSQPSILVDGEPVRFDPPAWIGEHTDPGLDDALAAEPGLPFAEAWAPLIAELEVWTGRKPGRVTYSLDDEGLVLEPEARALMVRVRARLESGEVGDGFDPELEAGTYALSALVHHGAGASTRIARAFWHWASRAGTETAMRTLLLARRYGTVRAQTPPPWRVGLRLAGASKITRFDYVDLPFLRGVLRTLGQRALIPILREEIQLTEPLQCAEKAWLTDDEAEAAVLFAQATHPSLLVPVIALAPTVEDASRVLREGLGRGPGIVRTVLRFGLPLAPAVLAGAAAASFGGPWIAPLACYPSAPAADRLVEMLGSKPDRALITDALAHMPEHAVPALERAHGKRLKHRAVIEALLARLGRSVTSASETVGEEAPLEALPLVLRDPPWRRQKRRAREVVIAGLVARDIAPTVALSSLDPRVLARADAETRDHASLGSCTGEQVLADLARGVRPGAISLLPMSIEDIELVRRAGAISKLDTWWPGPARAPRWIGMLHRYGTAVLPALIELTPRLSGHASRDLEYAGHVAITTIAIGWLAQRSTAASAWAWAERFPAHASAGLVPIALGKSSATRERARGLLRRIAMSARAILEEEAAHHGAESLAAIRAILDTDPLELTPTKPPELPYRIETIERPRLRDGGVLSREATTALAEMMAFTIPEAPYAGVALVREACDPASLDRFVASLIETWISSGMSRAHAWTVRATATLGSDAAARQLADRTRALARDGAKQPAITCIETLGAMGTDSALSQVGRLSRSGQRQYLKDAAARVLEEVGAARGLSVEELEDRTAPDLGLEADGTLALDFGPRSFHVGFDEQLVPFVRTAGGERLAMLPRAKKTDDATKARAAGATWKTLRSEAEKVAGDQIARLRRIMTDERRIARDVFVDAFVEHPLVGHLARRIVWGAYDASDVLRGAFRVAEDRSFATVDDDAYTLPEDAKIGVVHPHALRGTPESIARWGELLSGYEIVQPFAQLSRPSEAPSLEAIVARVRDHTTASAFVYALRKNGWRAHAHELGIYTMTRELGDVTLALQLDPPVEQGKSQTHRLAITTSKRGDVSPTAVQLIELAGELDAMIR